MVARREEIDESWRDHAACRGMSTELFFPNVSPDGEIPMASRQQISEALMVCKHCPVTVECWSYAKYFDERHGIWGGVLLNRRGRPQNRMTKVAM